MIDYNGKCATCIHFTPHDTGRSGVCDELYREIGRDYPYVTSFSRAGCVAYKLDDKRVCECGVYREGEYNYCPICGRCLREREA